MANIWVNIFLLVVIVAKTASNESSDGSSSESSSESSGESSDQPTYFENCPTDTLPSNSVFDPNVGEFQLLCEVSAKRKGECVILDVCLTDCFIPKILYSFQIGFEFEIKEGSALVGKFSYGMCSEDPTVFQIEICKLTQK